MQEEGAHETRRRHRHGHCLLDREQHPGGAASSREAKSGIVRAEKYAELGFRCQVHGAPEHRLGSHVPRKPQRFMGDGVAWNYIAMEQAIARRRPRRERRHRTSAPASIDGLRRPVDAHHRRRPPTSTARKAARSRSAPSMVAQGACARPPPPASPRRFQIKGINYSITSACSTSAHCIGNGVELIQWGKQDIDLRRRLRGARLDALVPVRRDGRHVAPSSTTPRKASRAYDDDRDGFVIAGGAGVVVLEELEHAKARGARRSTARSPATARPPTATTWLRRRAKAGCAACAWRSGSTASARRSTTSTPTAPARRSAT